MTTPNDDIHDGREGEDIQTEDLSDSLRAQE